MKSKRLRRLQTCTIVVLFIYMLLLGYSFNVIFHHGILFAVTTPQGLARTERHIESDKTVPEMLDDFRVSTQNFSDALQVQRDLLHRRLMRILFLLLVGVLILNGCGRPNDPAVRIVSVLQRPGSNLSWANEREMLQLTPQEKEAVAKGGVTGSLEVVSTAGRRSGSHEVRVIIIQSGPLKSSARIAIAIIDPRQLIQWLTD